MYQSDPEKWSEAGVYKELGHTTVYQIIREEKKNKTNE